MRDYERHNEEQLRAAWTRQYNHLYQLLDEDPLAAIEAAKELGPTGVLDSANIATLRACIYVDAGSAVKDPNVLREAARIFRRMVCDEPDRLQGHYNFANALSELALLISHEDVPWHLVTSGIRRVARSHFHKAAEPLHGPLASQAFTNHGNLLGKAYRWIEAYESYEMALLGDPRNGVAALRMAQTLLRYSRRAPDSAKRYRGLARSYLLQARESSSTTHEYGGRQAVDRIQLLLDSEEIRDADPITRAEPADEYTQFAVKNRLMLSPDITCCEEPRSRWDSLLIGSVVESADTPHGVPPIFAMFNQLKADFAAARWIAFVSRAGRAPETGYYSDTLDYAKYGLSQSLLLLAQRSAIDILDRVAVAASEHFGLPGTPSQITFLTRWHDFDRRKVVRPLRWQHCVSELVRDGNTALVALSELAEDLMARGALSEKKSLRHEATHRFVIQHDMGSKPSRDTPLIAHYDEETVLRETLASLQTARAAIFYLRDAIAIDAFQKINKAEGPIGQLDVPSHHYIRGEGDEPRKPVKGS